MKHHLTWLLSVQPDTTSTVLFPPDGCHMTAEGSSLDAAWLSGKTPGNLAHHVLTVRDGSGNILYAEEKLVIGDVRDALHFAFDLAGALERDSILDKTWIPGGPIADIGSPHGEVEAWWKWAMTDVQMLQLAVHTFGEIAEVTAQVHFKPTAVSAPVLSQADSDNSAWVGWERCRMQHPQDDYPTAEPTMDEILASIRRIIAEESVTA